MHRRGRLARRCAQDAARRVDGRRPPPFYQLLDGRHPTQIDSPSDELTALTHLWQGYLRHGRVAIRDLGERVLISAELVPSFAVIDLVVGRTIIDVKVSASADDQLDTWLNQILGYLLVDRHHVLLADRIGLYLGCQGLLLTTGVPELLAEASRGPTPQLATVREDCRGSAGGGHRQRSHLAVAGSVPDTAELTPLPLNRSTPLRPEDSGMRGWHRRVLSTT